MTKFWRRWSGRIGIAWTAGAFLWDVFWGIAADFWWAWALAAAMLVMLVYQIRMERKVRVRRMARAVDDFDEPIAPRNVRIEQPDGTVIPVELVYGGRDPITRMHMWFAVTPVRFVGMLRADTMPHNTAIAIQKSIE